MLIQKVLDAELESVSDELVDFMTGEPVPVEDVPTGEDSPGEEISEKDVEAVDLFRAMPQALRMSPLRSLPMRSWNPRFLPSSPRWSGRLVPLLNASGVWVHWPRRSCTRAVSAHRVDQYLAFVF